MATLQAIDPLALIQRLNLPSRETGDAGSSTDGSMSARRHSNKRVKRVIKKEAPHTPDPAPEPLDNRIVELRLGSSKKSKKKSKSSVAQSVFEGD